MQTRMQNPAFAVPGAMEALQAVGKTVNTAAKNAAVPAQLVHLVYLRASQINGCSVCVDMHARDAKKAGASDERLFGVAAWRESSHFSEAERSALALAEAVTRLNDRTDPVPDAIWNEAARHFEQPALAALVLAIATVNLWNRLNTATRQIVGASAR